MAIEKKPLGEELLRLVSQLSDQEQLELIAQLSRRLAKKLRSQPQHPTWMEMSGLGAEIWKGNDAQEYVSRERESWDKRPQTLSK